MLGRSYSLSVVALWLASMSWLVWTKVLPPLIIGDPPDYRAILEVQRGEPPVGWHLLANGRKVGWAVSQTKPLPNHISEIQSHVRFTDLPLEELTPGWLRALMQLVDKPLVTLKLDTESTVLIDPLGRLLSFDSVVRMDRMTRLARLRGSVEGAQMSLQVSAGEFSYQTEVCLPPRAMLGDAFSPQSQLPRLRAGQSWRVPAYNPLHPRQPLEMLKAEVEGLEPIVWQGKPYEAWLVVYRSDPGFGSGNDRTPRGKLWVRQDGTVLRQEMMLLDVTLAFVRMDDDEALRLQETTKRETTLGGSP